MSDSSLPRCSLCAALGEAPGAAHAGDVESISAGPGPHAPSEDWSTFFANLLDTTGFRPRWVCGYWPANLGWLHICSDIAIFCAYAAIPTALLYFILRRVDVPLRGIVWLFAAFILSCGITHALDASMFYHPAYRLLGVMKLVTAVVSIITAIALVRAMPQVLSVPGRLHDQETEIERVKQVKAEVAELNHQLFDRNSKLTVRTRNIEQAMDLAGIGMVRWEPATGVFQWDAGLREALTKAHGRAIPFSQWSDLLDTPELTTLLAISMEAARTGHPISVQMPISAAVAKGLRLRMSAAPERGPESPAIVGMVRVMDASVIERKMG